MAWSGGQPPRWFFAPPGRGARCAWEARQHAAWHPRPGPGRVGGPQGPALLKRRRTMGRRMGGCAVAHAGSTTAVQLGFVPSRMPHDVLRCRRVSQQTPVMAPAKRSNPDATRPRMLCRILASSEGGLRWLVGRPRHEPGRVHRLLHRVLARPDAAGRHRSRRSCFWPRSGSGRHRRGTGSLVGETGAKAIEAMIASASNIGSGLVGTIVGIITFVLVPEPEPLSNCRTTSI